MGFVAFSVNLGKYPRSVTLTESFPNSPDQAPGKIPQAESPPSYSPPVHVAGNLIQVIAGIARLCDTPIPIRVPERALGSR